MIVVVIVVHEAKARMAKRLIRREKSTPDFMITPTRRSTVRYVPPKSGHRLYSMVGEISMRWAFIEEILDSCIAALADTGPEITACITAQMMGHAPRCLTIKAIARWRGLPDVEKLADRLQGLLFETAELRNRAIHDQLLIETRTKSFFRNHRMSKKELHYGLKAFDRTEFDRALKLIEARRVDCVTLLNLIRDQVYEYYEPQHP